MKTPWKRNGSRWLLVAGCLVIGLGSASAQRGPGNRGGGGSGGSSGGGSRGGGGGGGSAPTRDPGSSRSGSSGGSSSGSSGSSSQAPRRDPGSSSGGSYTPRSGDRSGGSSGSSDYRPSRDGSSGRTYDYSGSRDGRNGYDGSLGSSRDYRGSEGRSFGVSRSRSYDMFSRSQEGRSFNNGIRVRPGIPTYGGGFLRPYFGSFCYYPYYCPPSISVGFIWSPWSVYWGVCPPYLYRERVIYVSPSVIYLDDDTTVYVRARDVRNSLDDYYLAPRNGSSVRDLPEEIREVVFSLRDTFLDANIEPLAKLIDPAVKIAVIRKGKYDYSLNPDDYLDMTRDMLRTAETREFAFLRSNRKSDNVWTLDFLHVYSDTKKEEKRTVVRYAVEKVLGKWVISQVSVLEDNEK